MPLTPQNQETIRAMDNHAAGLARFAESFEGTATIITASDPITEETATGLAGLLMADAERPLAALLATDIRALKRALAALEAARVEAVKATGRLQRFREGKAAI